MLAERVSKAHQDMEEQISANTALLGETSTRRIELRAKEEDIERLRVCIQPLRSTYLCRVFGLMCMKRQEISKVGP